MKKWFKTTTEIDFPFVFARVCRFYSMSYREVLDMPLKLFWTMARQISRLSAEEDIRQLEVQSAANNGEFGQKLMEKLREELGEPVSLPTPMPDHSAGIARLKKIQQPGS